jgi:hypothetical protein
VKLCGIWRDGALIRFDPEPTVCYLYLHHESQSAFTQLADNSRLVEGRRGWRSGMRHTVYVTLIERYLEKNADMAQDEEKVKLKGEVCALLLPRLYNNSYTIRILLPTADPSPAATAR